MLHTIMGITIHYRGTMDDISQVEKFEEHLLDLVGAIGGKATKWLSTSRQNSERSVRGLIVELEQGQDALSLLISPEGHLTPLFQIEEAETTPMPEPPYCFVKTQFGSVAGHIAIVHLLEAIGKQFCSNLEVIDEGEYYESRNAEQLSAKMNFLRTAIDSVAQGLREYPMSQEAAEDPHLLATRIESIARIVQQKLLDDQKDE